MSSRKRWQNIYSQENPFALPQAVVKGLGECCKCHDTEPSSKIQYLWVHLPSRQESLDTHIPTGELQPCLTLDEWLGIIDESASVGTKTLIISIGTPLAEQSLVAGIGEWAQSSHDMLVGIHRYGGPLTPEDATIFEKLDPAKTRLFLDEDFLDSASYVASSGVKVYSAEGIDDGVVSPKCDLPSTMTCVGPDGHVYSCGLVLGQEQFRFGHFFERKLAALVDDDSLPHVIPEGLSDAKHRCNGCPPLMAQRLRDDA